MANDKKFRCKKCGRPIIHKGNCLRCNLIAKREKDKKIIAKTSNTVSVLLSQILRIDSTGHKEIQLQLQNIFKNSGYFVELEKKIKAKRRGRIDLFAKKDNFSVGIEIDHSVLRWKSIDKLNTLRPNLAIFILKSRNINIDELELRTNLIRVKSLLVYLVERKIKNYNYPHPMCGR